MHEVRESEGEVEWFGADLRVQRSLKVSAYGRTECVLYVNGRAKVALWFQPDEPEDEVLRVLFNKWLKTSR